MCPYRNPDTQQSPPHSVCRYAIKSCNSSSLIEGRKLGISPCPEGSRHLFADVHRRAFAFDSYAWLKFLGNLNDLNKGSRELLSDWCQGIPHRRWRCWLGEPLDHSVALQGSKRLCEHPCRNPHDVGLKFGEAALTFAKIPDHICRPCTSKEVHAVIERALGRRRLNLAPASLNHKRLTKP